MTWPAIRTAAALANVYQVPGRRHTLCPSCGRVYRDSVIEETGTAPVAFRVDVTAGPIAEAIRVHWQLSAQE